MEKEEFLLFSNYMVFDKSGENIMTTIDIILCVQEVVNSIYIMSYYINWSNYLLDTWYIKWSATPWPHSSFFNQVFKLFESATKLDFLTKKKVSQRTPRN